MSEVRPKAVIHIGAGKTGSTSIQSTLLKNREALRAQGFKYLGLMLEHARTPEPHSWQNANGWGRFSALDPTRANAEIYAALAQELQRLKHTDIHTVIWSNESMCRGRRFFIPALQRLRDEGYDLRIICYVRDPERWARSAYAQWGIRHKTYRGPVQPFREWRKGRSFDFHSEVQPWLDAFPGVVRIYNYEAAGEVVGHFCNAIGCTPADISEQNVTPPAEIMAAWAVFNNRFDHEVLPAQFTRATRSSGVIEADALTVPPLAELYPDAADLADLRAACAADRERLNALLKSFDEPPLSEAPPTAKRPELDTWRTTQMLLRMIFALQEEVSELRQRLDRPSS